MVDTKAHKKEEKEGRQIKFKRKYHRSAAKQRSLFWLLFLLAFVIYLVYFFSQLGKDKKDEETHSAVYRMAVQPAERPSAQF